MPYQAGYKALRSLCLSQDILQWHRAKLTPQMLKPHEVEALTWVEHHVRTHHALPQIATLEAKFPDLADVEVIEPPSYYVESLEREFYYETINRANLNSQAALKENPDDYTKAEAVLQEALSTIALQRHRQRIINVGTEGAKLVAQAYHSPSAIAICESGWDYVDGQSGIYPGEIVSYIGRPAMGKTWKMLWSAMRNWRMKKRNTLFASMEMSGLPVLQRIASIYTQVPISQLKKSGFSSTTYKKFASSIKGMALESAHFYVIDANLAATVDDIYLIADMLECEAIFIDGAYLVRHPNKRLDRFTRAAENVEAMKNRTTELGAATFSSWQFNREQAKKSKKSGKQETDLEDIGYSDAIGQISSIVLGLFQEDGIETMVKRSVRVMKGRDGQVGQFEINWDFDTMDFSQVGGGPGIQEEQIEELEFI